MIEIKINEGDNFINISVTGHDESLACVSVSTLVMFLVIGLKDIASADVKLNTQGEGDLTISFAVNILKDDKASAVYSTFIKSVDWLCSKYNVKRL